MESRCQPAEDDGGASRVEARGAAGLRSFAAAQDDNLFFLCQAGLVRERFERNLLASHDTERGSLAF